MADATSSVSNSASPENKSTGEIQHDMLQTRESITEKVAALESQVVGTIQTAADTVTNTVDAVKEAVTSAPSAVSDTVKQTLDAVKQSVHDAVGSVSLSGCVRKNPWGSLGASIFAGFVAGYATGGSRATAAAAPVRREPAPMPAAAASQPPNLVSDLCEMAGRELRQLAEQSLSSFLQSLKHSIGNRVPDVVDTAVNRVADQLQTPSRMRASSVNGV